MAGEAPSGQRPIGEGIPGYGSQQGGDVPSWLSGVAQVAGALNPVTGPEQISAEAVKSLLGGGGGGAAAPGKAKTKPKATESAAQKQADATKAYEQQIQQVENNPWTRMANSLANEAQSVFAQINPAASGATGVGAQAGAANQALASLGLSSGSSPGQWLSSQTQAAQATAAPVNAAMAAEGAQYAAEQGPITKAIQNWGQANAIQDITAPEASWLNALASHVTSNLSYYGQVPTAALPSLSPDVAAALQQSGGYGGAAGAGITPIQNIVPSGTGGSKSGLKAPAGNAGAALAGAATGAIPTPSVAPSG